MAVAARPAGEGRLIGLKAPCQPLGRWPSAVVPSHPPFCNLSGSVSGRSIKYNWVDEGRDLFSGGCQHTQNRCGAAKEVEPAVVGGHLLIGSGAGTEKV